MPEELKDYERAVSEYEKLSAAHPCERESLEAQMSAARLCLKRLNRPQDALRFYEAVSSSAVPHLDLEQDLELGIRESRTLFLQVENSERTASSAIR